MWPFQSPRALSLCFLRAVDVRPGWGVKGQITFPELVKLTTEPPEPTDVRDASDDASEIAAGREAIFFAGGEKAGR
eukprot:5624083-Pleurochrysis_carterae.AAC.1